MAAKSLGQAGKEHERSDHHSALTACRQKYNWPVLATRWEHLRCVSHLSRMFILPSDNRKLSNQITLCKPWCSRCKDLKRSLKVLQRFSNVRTYKDLAFIFHDFQRSLIRILKILKDFVQDLWGFWSLIRMSWRCSRILERFLPIEWKINGRSEYSLCSVH